MNRRVTVFCLTALTAALWCASAQAQSPYSAIQPSAALITDGTFKRSPLRLPFEQASVTTMSKYGRTDFKHVYNAPIDKVMAFLELNAGKRPTGVDIIDATVYPRIAGQKVFARTQRKDLKGGRFIFGASKTSRSFVLVLKPMGTQTEIIFENVLETRLYGGLMPPREGYTPIGVTQKIGYRFN